MVNDNYRSRLERRIFELRECVYQDSSVLISSLNTEMQGRGSVNRNLDAMLTIDLYSNLVILKGLIELYFDEFDGSEEMLSLKTRVEDTYSVSRESMLRIMGLV